jgi:hypothetical protein
MNLLLARARPGVLKRKLCFVAAAGLALIGGNLLAQTNVKAGFGAMANSDVKHRNGNVYDQVLLTGPNVTVAADPGQIVRVSFLDLNDDITQVEFAGSGTVSIEIEASSYQQPAPPQKYIQPDVSYVKGRAIVRVRDAAADTFVNVFSVGRGNAVNETLFPAGMVYDAMADIQLLNIQGAEIGAVMTGNVRYSASDGPTGLHAPDTRVRYRVVVGEIAASAEAVPLLRIGEGSPLEQDGGVVLVAGGRLEQPNGSPIDVTSRAGTALPRIDAVAGTKSSGEFVPAAVIEARFFSRSPGFVSVNGAARATRGYVPASFGELRSETGLDVFDFGEDVGVSFSGGNSGNYAITMDTIIEGELVHGVLRGTYGYVVDVANQNRMTFTMTFSTLSLSSASVSFEGTIYQLASMVGEILPVRITAAADFVSAVSGTATVTVLFTSGAQQSETLTYDEENGLDFAFF